MHRIASLLLLCLPVLAQVPDAAHVDLYVPHIADGTASGVQLQTRFTFVNPNDNLAYGQIQLIGEDGNLVAIDFGQGETDTIDFTVPGHGVRTFRSRGTGRGIAGWAFVGASLPLQTAVAIRRLRNGTPESEITVHPTIPATSFVSAATPTTLVALTNVVSDQSIPVTMVLTDSDGAVVSRLNATLQAGEHRSFNVNEVFRDLPTNYRGTLLLSSPRNFVAWMVDQQNGLSSTMPDGRSSFGASQWDNIQLAYFRVLDAARTFMGFGDDAVKLNVSTKAEINAWGGNNEIQINLALAELIHDSPSELAFVIGHELGHVYQGRTRRLNFVPDNAEFDADVYGLFTAIAAGYDPYGAAGALAKLAMVTGRAGLAQQFEDQTSADAHKSFNSRLESLFEVVSNVCSSSPDVKTVCDQYKSAIHPHFPKAAPLTEGNPEPVIYSNRLP